MLADRDQRQVVRRFGGAMVGHIVVVGLRRLADENVTSALDGVADNS